MPGLPTCLACRHKRTRLLAGPLLQEVDEKAFSAYLEPQLRAEGARAAGVRLPSCPPGLLRDQVHAC